jgi:hypothetical protein
VQVLDQVLPVPVLLAQVGMVQVQALLEPVLAEVLVVFLLPFQQEPLQVLVLGRVQVQARALWELAQVLDQLEALLQALLPQVQEQALVDLEEALQAPSQVLLRALALREAQVPQQAPLRVQVQVHLRALALELALALQLAAEAYQERQRGPTW